MAHYIVSRSGVPLWWCGSIEKVLRRREDQQWSVAASYSVPHTDATPYEDSADALYALLVLSNFDEVSSGWLAVVEY